MLLGNVAIFWRYVVYFGKYVAFFWRNVVYSSQSVEFTPIYITIPICRISYIMKRIRHNSWKGDDDEAKADLCGSPD